MKIVANRRYGGFNLSRKAKELLNIPVDAYTWKCDRTDERLIAAIEERGSKYVSGNYAKLEVVEIPDEATDWYIDNYDGMESIFYVVGGKIYIAPYNYREDF